jgi:hypothetical protein
LAPDDVDAQVAAALAAMANGLEDIAQEMLERARLIAVEGDLVLVEDVEERVDAGHEAASSMLTEDFAPDMLRSRLRERP